MLVKVQPVHYITDKWISLKQNELNTNNYTCSFKKMKGEHLNKLKTP